jgi:hypothetical protein
MSAPEGRSPVFVVGAMRSGTTLLRLMLNESPDLAIPAESHFVARLVRTLEPGKVLTDEERTWAVDFITSKLEWQRDYTTSDDELEAALADDPITLADLLDRLFRTEIAHTGKPRWGDKTPDYLFFVQHILGHFPDANVVAIVRDPRDVYLSLKRYDWAGRTTWSIGGYLSKCGRLADRWAAAYPAPQFVVVRYEDLVLDTAPTLERLCATLGLRFDERMLSFFEGAGENVQPWEFEIGAHTKLRRDVDASDVGRWRVEGDRKEIAEVESLTADIIRDHGYDASLSPWRASMTRSQLRARHAFVRRFGQPDRSEPADG